MSAPAQAGQTLIVGFGEYSWTGYMPDDGLTEVTGYENEEEVDDLNGNPRTKIRSGEYIDVSGAVTIDDTDPATALYTILPGSIIEMTAPGDAAPVSYEVQEWTPSAARLAVKVNFRLRKDAIDYSA